VKSETSVAAEPGGLEALAGLAQDPTLEKAVPLLTQVANDGTFLSKRDLLLLLWEAKGADEWYVAHRIEDGSYSLEVFVWPPGTGTQIHDHTSWGVFRCLAAMILEERYERLDDGLRFEHARLRKAWHRTWKPEDGVSTVLPGNDGIHRVRNQGGSTAISMHLYGSQFGEVNGRDYDPSRDYVCDRRLA
jgi:predicted metal-dependent enzyme (double-stranded beta helix superfamily)